MVCEDYKKHHPMPERSEDFDVIEYELAERMKADCPVWKNASHARSNPAPRGGRASLPAT